MNDHPNEKVKQFINECAKNNRKNASKLIDEMNMTAEQIFEAMVIVSLSCLVDMISIGVKEESHEEFVNNCALSLLHNLKSHKQVWES